MQRLSVLVTGASGFVGRRLAEQLSCKPRFGVRTAVRQAGLSPPGVMDVATVSGLDASTDWSVALHGIDTVVHLAARVHVLNEAASDPLSIYRRVNVQGTVELGRQAANAGVRRLVFVSSIKVNGESTQAGRPFTESDPRAPLDPYGVSKAEAEVALLDLALGSQMEVTIIRPPLVYGPGVKANFRRMVELLARGIPLPLGGFTDNRRSFLALDNLVTLIEACILHPSAGNEVFLASDGEDLSTVDLLRRTARAMGVRARLIPVPAALIIGAARITGRQAAIQRLAGNLQVDSSKARRLLGWNPRVSVDEGLRAAVDDLRSLRSV